MVSSLIAVICALRSDDDFCRERKSCYDERLLVIGLHDQNIPVGDSPVQLAESLGAAFHYRGAILAENRDAQVRAAISGARYLLGGDAAIL
jgi:hypothetical protein